MIHYVSALPSSFLQECVLNCKITSAAVQKKEEDAGALAFRAVCSHCRYAGRIIMLRKLATLYTADISSCVPCIF